MFKFFQVKVVLFYVLWLLVININAQDANIWRRYVGENQNTNIPLLPDYSYAGYHFGVESIPEKHNQEIFNVIDYGAIPNDGHSDQLAIQSAIDAAAANKGGVVFFPSGVYDAITDVNNAVPIMITSSNIVLKGSGSGPDGTMINMRNHMLIPEGRKKWHTPPMILFSTDKKAEGRAVEVTRNALRGDKKVYVNDARALVGIKYCKLFTNPNLATNKQFFGDKKLRETWEVANQQGVDLSEFHEIKSIDTIKNEIEFQNPIIDDLNATYGWMIQPHYFLEECGFEDIYVVGNFSDNFVHHLDYIHDYAWDGVGMHNVAHSWIRRSRFSNVTKGAGMVSAFASTIHSILVDGNDAHNLTGIGRSTAVLQGLIMDNTTDGTWHGVDMSSRTAGSVVWRIESPRSRGLDLHASFPRTNLIDNYTARNVSGQGGASVNIPHHLTGLTIWNYNRTGEPGKKVNFWYDCGEPYCGLTVVDPIIVGYHGAKTSFMNKNVKYQEAKGRVASPVSLYEAQLSHRLGRIPDWVGYIKKDYERLKIEWSKMRPVPPMN